MLYKRNLLIVLSIILSVVLVACGGGDAGSVDLSQSITLEDELGGTASISYPEGWSANSDNGLFSMASSEELLAQAANSDLPDVSAGEVVAVSMILPAEMASFFVDDGAEVSVAAIASAFVADLADETDTVNETEETTINDKAAAVVTGTTEGVDIVLVAIEVGEGNYAIVFGATAEGEGGDIRATIEAMAGSLEYTAASGE